MDKAYEDRWKVLLIGGSTGVGKTYVARELARQLSVSLLLLDDIRIALQHATTPETKPDLHLFLKYRAEQWRNPDSIVDDWIRVGRAMVKPLEAIIRHHLIVPSVGPVIIEGDGILPEQGSQFLHQKEVCFVFIVEQDEVQLLKNLRLRGRGFNEEGKIEQEAFAHASWLYGQWLARGAEQLGLPVIQAQPQQTLYERLLSSIGPRPEGEK